MSLRRLWRKLVGGKRSAPLRMLRLELEANDRETHHRRVNMTLRPEAHDLGRKLARYNNRNFSSLVEILIEREAQRVFGGDNKEVI